MRKKALLIIAVCTVALVVTSLFVWVMSRPEIPQKYERTITRNIDSQEEENALAAAETFNYSEIFSVERFDGSSDPEAYLQPGTYLAYTYAHFIDSEVINYYETRYDNLQKKGDPKQIELTYEANVQKWPEIRIFNSPSPENETLYNNTIVISAPNGSVLFKNPDNTGPNSGMKFVYRNQSGYQMIQQGFDLNFSDCYVVEMKLVYSETYAPVAAFTSDVYQIVVVDHNFVPVLLCVQSQNVVA